LVEVFERALEGRIDQAEIEWDRRTALGVVLAAGGYPDSPRSGDVIEGLPAGGNAFGDDCFVFHAGTVREGDRTLTSGGRVLCMTALGDSVRIAQARAYRAIEN